MFHRSICTQSRFSLILSWKSSFEKSPPILSLLLCWECVNRKHTPPSSSEELGFAKRNGSHRGKNSMADMASLVFIGLSNLPPAWKVFFRRSSKFSKWFSFSSGNVHLFLPCEGAWIFSRICLRTVSVRLALLRFGSATARVRNDSSSSASGLWFRQFLWQIGSPVFRAVLTERYLGVFFMMKRFWQFGFCLQFPKAVPTVKLPQPVLTKDTVLPPQVNRHHVWACVPEFSTLAAESAQQQVVDSKFWTWIRDSRL